MVPEIVALVLTALAAVVVVLTRVRMTRPDQDAAGRLDIPTSTLVNVHTVAGSIAVVVWAGYILASLAWPVGLAGLVLWWLTALAGILILARWLPARGRHASGPAGDSWGEGPGLSILGHVGLVVGCVVWTALFVTGSL
ncbi:MAG TPA: hypothetical protein VFL69_16875 [Marmoricola sp.]|nr:hypothetical protein [Marmoricola sp.]